MQRAVTDAHRAVRVGPALATALIVAAIAGLMAIAPLNVFDGGISPSSATFTLHGQLPYRDYWLLYGPLSGWLFALPLAVLGPSGALIMVAGLVAVVAAGLAGLVLIAGQRIPAAMAVLIAAASVVLLAPFHGLEFSAWPLAMAFALGGLAAARLDRPLLAGALLGLAFLSRLDVGGYAILAALVFPSRVRIVGVAAAVVAPIALLVLVTTPLDRLVEQVIWWPLIGNRQFRGLTAPSFGTNVEDALVALVLLLLPRAVILAAAIQAIRRRLPREMVALTIFAALCQLQTLGRPDPTHFVQAATPALLLLAGLVDRRSRLSRLTTLTATGVVFGFGLTGLVFWIAPPDRSEDVALRDAAAAVREATAPDEPIYVGTTDHRYTIANALLGYYFAERRPGTRTSMFNPGITTRDDRQAEMAAELDAAAVRVLLLDSRYEPLPEESDPSRAPGSQVLDRWIATNFAEACRFGPIVLMERRGTEARLDCR
jgi:hypothetical protein